MTVFALCQTTCMQIQLLAVFWWPSWLDLVGCFSQWQTVCFLILVYSFLPDVDILKGKNLMCRKEYLLSN